MFADHAPKFAPNLAKRMLTKAVIFETMLEILPIPAFKDNYIWLIHDGRHAVVVDPGDAKPVIAALARLDLILDIILVTHHHNDHIGGIPELLSNYDAQVYAPAKEHYDFPHTALNEGDIVSLPNFDLNLQVLELPGHTLDHIAYYADPYLFCGDTLFSCGCGRLFEGTPEQMYRSLQRLAVLPAHTKVYCTHEYTALNIAFARSIDSGNTALQARQQEVAKLRSQDLPSLPSSIALELQTNPFLRCDDPAIRQALELSNLDSSVDVFTKLRSIRNHY
jgi:hydroxyacylglutathione hydrolase